MRRRLFIANWITLWLIVASFILQFTAVALANDLPEFLYVDDDVNCQGFSPEQYQHRIREHQNLQRRMYQQYHSEMADQAASEQRAYERIRLARRARFENEARHREELIARRRAASPSLSTTKSVTTKTSAAAKQ